MVGTSNPRQFDVSLGLDCQESQPPDANHEAGKSGQSGIEFSQKQLDVGDNETIAKVIASPSSDSEAPKLRSEDVDCSVFGDS